MTEQEFEPQPQQQQRLVPQAPAPCTTVFNSVDFQRFLSSEFPKDSGAPSPFLSKENSLPSYDVPSIFKSKDSFSNIFSSSEWDTQVASKVDLKEPNVQLEGPTSMDSSQGERPYTRSQLTNVFSSRDWMSMNTLGSHIDVSINREMFGLMQSDVGSTEEIPNTSVDRVQEPVTTNWDDVFYSQLQLIPPPPTTSPDELSPEPDAVLSTGPQTTREADRSSDPLKKKRKRKPRKKVVPEKKVYVEPRDTDVLLGRGGRSNHHPGNKRYREEVKNLRCWYAGISDKDEKTDLSQCLVDYVHSYQGRFLDKDGTGWYEVPNIVARRKASQALREDTDPEKRAAKRARFLKKRAEAERLQQAAAAV